MTGVAPLVSVVIPTRDGMRTLPAVMRAVRAQKGDFSLEVVAVDSGSRDGSAEWLAREADRLVTVPPAEFDHGVTRNVVIAAARGELVALLVQDAEPADPGWLGALIAPLRADPRIAGSFARQLPRPDTGAIARHQLASWVGGRDAGRIAMLRDAAEWLRLSPWQRLELAAFDDVSSCLRRSVWERIPLPRAAIAEDLEWGIAVLRAGLGLAYVPEARVWHCHERGPWYELKRTYLVHRRLHELVGLRTVPNLVALARAVATTGALHSRLLAGTPGGAPPREWVRALALAAAWPLGQWLGGHAGARGRGPSRLPGV